MMGRGRSVIIIPPRGQGYTEASRGNIRLYKVNLLPLPLPDFIQDIKPENEAINSYVNVSDSATM